MSALQAGGGVAPATAALPTLSEGMKDESASMFAKLLILPTTPPELAGLATFMGQPPAATLPLFPDTYYRLPLDLHPCFHPAYGRLAQAFAACIDPLPFGSLSANATEQMTLLAEQSAVICPLLAMDMAAGMLSLGLLVERDAGDDRSLMTLPSAGGHTQRPDGVLRHRDGIRMLMKWENKAAQHNILDALADLSRKTATWTSLYYGNTMYLPCFAAAGSAIQFVALTACGSATTSVPISRVFDLNSVHDRVIVLQHTVQLYKLLLLQQRLYPQYVLAVNRDIIHDIHLHGGTVRRTLYFCSNKKVARKRVEPWDVMAAAAGVEFPTISRVYAATASRQGVVHASSGPTLLGSRYDVELLPVGRPGHRVQLLNEDDVRLKVHGLLHGLNAIHEIDCNFRDFRDENAACSSGTPRRWFLLDVESCARNNQPPCNLCTGLEAGVLVGGLFTFASDIALLGKMLARVAWLVTSREGREFLAAVCKPAADSTCSAAELLGHEWLACEGAGCRAAGAQPGES